MREERGEGRGERGEGRGGGEGKRQTNKTDMINKGYATKGSNRFRTSGACAKINIFKLCIDIVYSILFLFCRFLYYFILYYFMVYSMSHTPTMVLQKAATSSCLHSTACSSSLRVNGCLCNLCSFLLN